MSFTLEELFRLGTVEQLALAAAGRSGEPPIRRTAAGELLDAVDREKLPAAVEDAYPLAELQAGMLFHSVFSAETAVYHDVFSSRIAAPWDEQRVRQAVAAAMRRHAVLRTSLAPSGYSRPLQLVHREVDVPLAVEDLSALSAEEQEARVAAWLQAEKQRAFDWSVAPLFLIQVHRLAESQFQLSLSFHHAILDGWSVATLLAELFAEVGAMQEGAAAAIRSPGLSYRDFVALEAAAVASPETRAYWQGLLAGHSRTQLPRLPGVRGGLGTLGVEQRQLDPRLTAGVKTLAQRSGVPLKTVLLAAHLRVLALVCGQADVLTGLVSNSRPEEADGERVLGLFLNTLPMRLTLRPESWPALLQRVFQAEHKGCRTAAIRPAACSASIPASRSTRRPSTTITSTSTAGSRAAPDSRSRGRRSSSIRTSR